MYVSSEHPRERALRHLEAARKALKVKPREAIVVGDSARDMERARRLKVLAIGVTTGFSAIEELTRAGAAYLTRSPSDILNLLQKLNRKIENTS